MIIKSKFTGKEYNTKDVCRIVNTLQLASYLEYGITLLDIYTSRNYETGKPILVGIVDKKESYEAYKLWCEHKL